MQTIRVGGVGIELFDSGQGRPLLLLHGEEGFSPAHPYVAPLARGRRLLVPCHPGFGKSDLPDWLDQVDDIAYLYLQLMDRLGLRDTDLVGCSIGGWIASEMATKAPERFTKIVLCGPVGVKVGAADKLDIPDVFAMPQARLDELLFHQPDKFRFDPGALSDEELTARLRNRETLALLSWEPYMHNPKLRHRLARASMPVLLLRGESDGLVSPEYLAAYAGLFPGARTAIISLAGHLPQLEQPQAFVEHVVSFLD